MRSGRYTGRKRRKPDQHQVRVYKREWVDPFPEIMGTKPEKMVLAELFARRIPFYFQYPYGDVAGTAEVEDYRLDFYIPSSKIVIEVNGDYWHGSAEAMNKDALRYALLELKGLKVLPWWESEILTGLRGLFEREPLLNHPSVTGPPISMENNFDDLRALRKMNAKRRGRMAVTLAKRPRGRRRRGG